MERCAGRRTGVAVELHTTSSARKAQQALLEMLDAGQPVMIGCDMGFLPYFDFGGQEYHFGGHAVVICGYDPETDQVLVADRDDALNPVSMAALGQARGSTYKPFPPQNLWYTFDFHAKRQPTADEVRQAILEQTQTMLAPPISNIGVKGIHKAAEMVPRWPKAMSAEELRWSLFNAYIFISAEGGTGGGIFRYMFSRFLHEAAGLTGDPRLEESAAEFQQIGDRWQELAGWFHQASNAPDPAAPMGECGPLLHTLAGMEEAAWQRLRGVVDSG